MPFDNGDDGRVTVTGAATLIVRGKGNGVTIAVKNLDAGETVAVGGPGVTFAEGYPLGPGEAIGYVADDGDNLYGISDGSNVVVAVLRQGV